MKLQTITLRILISKFLLIFLFLNEPNRVHTQYRRILQFFALFSTCLQTMRHLVDIVSTSETTLSRMPGSTRNAQSVIKTMIGNFIPFYYGLSRIYHK